MPVRVGWGNQEQTFIYFQMIGGASIEEVAEGLHTWREMLESVPYTVGALINIADAPPVSLQMVRKLAEAEIIPPGYADIVIVGADSMDMSAIYTALGFGTGSSTGHIKFMPTTAKAQEYLERKYGQKGSNIYG